MSKTATIRTRIEPGLKNEVEDILAEPGREAVRQPKGTLRRFGPVRTFSRTSQFKWDVKLAGKRGKDLAKLKAVPDLLIESGVLPESCEDHPLRGNFAGSRDCHVESDRVLIYTLAENDLRVRFERTGTHSVLFR